MALQGSGAISLNNVNVELSNSGTATITMNTTAVRSLAGKASGAISMSDFYGKSAETIQLSNQDLLDVGTDPQTAGCFYRLESDGDVITGTDNGGSTDVGDWITPKGNAPSDYQCRVTVNSGALTYGTTGSWLALSTTREWGCGTVTIYDSPKSANITVEIRKGEGSVLASCTVTMSATLNSGE